MPATYRGHTACLPDTETSKHILFGIALARARENLPLSDRQQEALGQPPEAFLEPDTGPWPGNGPLMADVWLKPELKAHIAELLAAYE